MDFSEIRLYALGEIYTTGYWQPVIGCGEFTRAVLDGRIEWIDNEIPSKATRWCFFKLEELTNKDDYV